ncbi:MAG: response regulator [Desulfobacteraceae bacterium]|nr:response regulator [Desulfobacteraceae bacterium]
MDLSIAECEDSSEVRQDGCDSIYKTIVENDRTEICIVREWKIVFVNKAMVESLGYDRSFLIDRGFLDLVFPGDAGLVAATHEKWLKGDGGPDTYRLRLVHRDGRLLLFEVKNVGIVWEGKPVTLFSLRDITAQRRAEKEVRRYRDSLEKLVKLRTAELTVVNHQLKKEIDARQTSASALRKSEEKYRKILEGIKEGYFEVDLAGNLTFFNDALCAMSGHSPSELMGKNNLAFATEKSAKQLFKTFSGIYRTGQSADIADYEMRRVDGSRGILELSAYLMRDEGGKPIGFRGFTRDVTERKRAEDALQRAHDELEKRVEDRTRELQKAMELSQESVKVKNEFLANMSHEIRTPMNAIIGMSDLLLDTVMTRKQREHLNIIRSSSRSLLELINDILDFSKIEAGKLDFESIPFLLSDVVEEVSDMFLEKVRLKNIEFVLDIALNVPGELKGDPFRLKQVLVNLVSNAVKFTHKGEIRIKVSNLGPRGQGTELLFEVHDSGIGISRDLLHDNGAPLLETFAQADGSTTRKYGGTGLGLAISNRIVGMMDGKIFVESREGKGSVFKFTATFKNSSAGLVPRQVLPPNLLRTTALVVESNASTSMVMKRQLEGFGFRTVAVDSGERALDILAGEGGHKVGIAFVDLQLYDMDGLELVSRIKAVGDDDNGFPMVVLGSSGTSEEIRTVREMEIESYLMKPVKQSTLFDTVMEIFGYHQDRSQAVKSSGGNNEELKGMRVLLVEDNIINQMVATEILKDAGIRIITAGNGLEAIETLMATEVDAVLMDVQMPEMDGLEAASAIRNNLELKHLPIIAMTAHAMYGDREKCLASGMNDYVPKPINRNELFSVLRKNVFLADEGDGKKSYSKITVDTNRIYSLPGLDIDEGLQRVGGAWDVYVGILNKFCQLYKGFSRRIRQMAGAGDFANARIQAHSLKGAAGNVAAEELRLGAKKLENACFEKDAQAVAKVLPMIETAFDMVVSSLEKMEKKQVAREKAPCREVGVEEVLREINAMEGSLREFDPVEAEACMERLRGLVDSGEGVNGMDRLLSTLGATVGDYNFDEALTVLTKVAVKVEDMRARQKRLQG